jgi:hypothetical protein
MIDYLEIRDQKHLMYFEGSSDKRPTKKEIKKAVLERGFYCKDIGITYDNFQGFYRFNGYLSTTHNSDYLTLKRQIVANVVRNKNQE